MITAAAINDAMIPNGAIQKRLITDPPRRQLDRPRPIPMQPAAYALAL